MHGHRGREMPEVALHDVDRDAGVQQAGGQRYLYLIL
jgi:hypothetical protein